VSKKIKWDGKTDPAGVLNISAELWRLEYGAVMAEKEKLINGRNGEDC
jgi:hypothetical protein